MDINGGSSVGYRLLGCLQSANKESVMRSTTSLTIIDNTATPSASTTTLNAIPVGQYFKGELTTKNSRKIMRGVFRKSHGRWRDSSSGYSHDVMVEVVRVDKVTQLDGATSTGNLGYIFDCLEVRDYEPLRATLTLDKA